MRHWCSRCNADREMLPLERAGLALCSHCGKARYDEPGGAAAPITRAPVPHECPRCMEMAAHELADGHSACYQCGWSGSSSAVDHPEQVGGERWFKEMSRKNLPPGRSSSGGGKSRNEKSGGSFLDTPLSRVDWFEEERHRCRMREHRERRAVRLSAELRRQVAALSAGAGLSVSQMILAAMHAQLELWISDVDNKDVG